jgi:glycosyltransferase involved in cell wall biosynthesis
VKIAITSLYLPSGSKIGVGYVVHTFANKMIQRGHEVTVFSQTGPSPDSLYKVVVVPSGKRLRTFGFAWALRKYDFSQFDLLHAHGDDWFLWGCKLPRHIHTLHGSCLAEMIHAKGFTQKLRMAGLALGEFSACMLADELVAVSANTRRYNPWAKLVIPNGVDLDLFRPGEEKSEVPALLFVGTMHGRKRGAMLLDIFQREIRPRVPRAEFWAVCEEKVEGEGVRWMGRVDLEKLVDLYRRAWVFCLPSSYEGFGVPYIESMASGTPVVATPNVGACEVTDDGRCGIIASEEELGENLVRMLTDTVLRDRMRRAGLNRARDFAWDRVCDDYEALYTADSTPVPRSQAA